MFLFVSLLPKPLVIMNPFAEGGSFFMSLILISFLISLYLLVRGFLSIKSNQKRSEKMLTLVVDSSLLGLAIGFLASVIGLIGAFDSVEAMGDPDPAVFAGGLKVSLLTATFGLFTFVISRLGILILRWMQNE